MKSSRKQTSRGGPPAYNNTSSASPILRFLERNAGETVKISEILHALNEPKKGKQRDSDDGDSKSKGRSRASKKGKQHETGEVHEILEALAELGAVQFSGATKLRINKPFHLTGRISFSPKGPGFVGVRGAPKSAREIFIAPPNARSALDGDLVVVRLKDRSRDRFEGTVMDIQERSRTYHRMRLLQDADSQGKFAAGETLDLPSRLVACADVSRLPEDSRDRLKSDVVIVVRLTGKRMNYQGASVLEAIFERFEDDTDLDVDFARVLMKYDLDPGYPSDIELPKEIDEEPNAKNVRNWKKREDLRDLPTITIDGADSKDFDDALTYVPAGRGKAKLYVHIADVAHYVERDSDLDQEALRRATSYYLSNRVVPMLPPALSENLCSLIAHQNRLAFTCEMEIQKKDGKILSARFYKSIIKVDQRLTYDIAESFLDGATNRPGLDGKEIPKTISSMVQDLWKMAQAQRKRRMKAGRIDLNLPEAKVKINPGTDRIDSISYSDRLKSSMLIEECMLSANICVGAYLRTKKANALYRVHEPMDPTKIANLNQFFESYNINFTLKDARHASITKAVQAVEKHVGGARLDHVFQTLLLRSFMQATYSPEPGGHWGLGFDDYCHFTSPIRRYPDLIVHRALQNIIEKKKAFYTADEVAELGTHTSEQERRAMEAERDTFRLKVMRYIQQEKMTTFTGFITGFKYDRVFLEIEGMPTEAVVEAQHLTNERELLLTDKFSAFIKNLGRPALLGEKWELELDRLDTEAMRIFCKPIFSTRKPRARTKGDGDRSKEGKDDQGKNNQQNHKDGDSGRERSKDGGRGRSGRRSGRKK
ncbi:MAG: VacB/RNase II family 3'-5' exoribonuclease [bacterium]|nr:VacB/RNase II family 3'-5' exoribonuclease [bacterium]